MKSSSKIVQAPVTNVSLGNNKAIPIETSSIKNQQQTVSVFTSQSNFSNVFSVQDAKLDFTLPPYTNSIHAPEKITLMLELQANYPATGVTPVAFQLPALFSFITRLECRVNGDLIDTLWSENLFAEKMFLNEEDLANDAIVELFNPVNFALSSQYPGLYVSQNNVSGSTQTFRVYLNVRSTFLTSKGFLLPKIKAINTLRFFFKTLSQINVTNSANNLTSLTLSNAELYVSGIKYSDDELQSLLASDYANTFICKTLFRRFNVSDLVTDVNRNSNNLPTSYLRGRFLCVAFYIRQKNPVGEQNMQYRLSVVAPNAGVSGVVSSVQPIQFASSPNLQVANNGYNYSYIPDSLSIDNFQFLDSSSNPVYTSNIKGDMLRNIISNNNSASDFLYNYAIYPFMFTSNPQEDYHNQNAQNGSKFIDGLYSLQYSTKYNLSELTDQSGNSLNFQNVGCALQCGEVHIESDGSLKFVRYDN